MTYTTKSWGNDPVGGTPLNATGMNDLEARIAAGVNIGVNNLREIYATDYGVVANGVTDDSTALNAAFTAAAAGISGQTFGNVVWLPAGTMKVGSQIVVKNKVRVVGTGKRSTNISAIAGTFPTNTPVIRLGDPLDSVAFDQRLEHLAVECADITDSQGVYSRNANEGSGCFDVIISNFNKYGLEFDQCSIIGSYNLELFGGSLGTALAGFYAHGCAGQNWVRNVTTIPNVGDGIAITNSQFRITDIHAETSAFGVHIRGGNGQIENIHGHPACTTLVKIEADTRDWIVSNLNKNGSTNLFIDDINGYTSTSSVLEFYSQDSISIGNTMIKAGQGSIPTTGTHVLGEIVFDSSPTAGSFVGWICTVAGSPGTWKTFGAISP